MLQLVNPALAALGVRIEFFCTILIFHLADGRLYARIYHHATRKQRFFLLFFYFSKAAGGGRGTLLVVAKSQIPKKPPALLGGFFCTAMPRWPSFWS
jgi:hypothetical protein